MATAIAAPLMAEAYPPTSMRNSIPSCWPSVLTMVPMSREQNRPWAMAPRASMPYRLAEISMFLRFKNARSFSISLTFFRDGPAPAGKKAIQVSRHLYGLL